MARPNYNKNTGDSYSAAEWGQIKDKCNNPGLNDAWSSVVKFDDNYYPPEQTISTNTTYTIDATNAGTGNGRCDQIVASGTPTLTFTGFTIRKSDLTVSTDTVTLANGGTYTIIFLRRGAISEVYLSDNQATAAVPVTFSNFRIDSANPDRVLFDADQVWTGTTFAGFTLATPSKTITGITGSGTTSGYLTVSVAYTAGDTSPTIAYDGTDDITSAGGDLAAFTATAITNNIIDYPVVSSMTVENADPNTVVVVFDEAVNITSVAGWTFRINAVGETLNSVTGTGTNTLNFAFTNAAQNGDTLDMAYDSGTGNVTAVDDSQPLQTFTATSVTNNVASSFVPGDIASLQMWIDFDDDAKVTVSGSDITSVSHNGHTLNGTASFYPQRVTGVNSKRAAQWTGTQYGLSNTSPIDTITSAYTVYVVSDLNDDLTAQQRLFKIFNTAGSNPIALHCNVNQNDDDFATGFVYDGANKFDTNSASSYGIKRLAYMATENGNLTTRVDGVNSAGTAIGTFTALSADLMLIGGNLSTAVSATPDGEVYDILIFNTELSETDLDNLDAYFAAKLAI